MNVPGLSQPRPKRIGLVIDRFTVGGGLRHIYQIARGIREFEFGIFAYGDRSTGEFNHLPNVHLFPKGYDVDYLFQFKPDLIHIHHLKPLFKFYRNPLFKPPIPVYFTVHGLHIHKYDFMNGMGNRIKRYLRFRLENYLLKKVDEVITVSREDQGFVKKRYQVRAPVYIPNGVNWREIQPLPGAKTALRRQLKLPQDAFLFLTVARFPFQKGHDVLLKAIARIPDQLRRKKARFIFVGDGRWRCRMQEYAERLSIADLVDFKGSSDEVYRFMNASDVFLLPSRWEGLPITLLEAACCKLPLVASDTYGNREIVAHNRTGLLFENECSQALSKVLQEILAEKPDLKKLAENAYLSIKEFYPLCAMLERLRKLYLKPFETEYIHPRLEAESLAGE